MKLIYHFFLFGLLFVAASPPSFAARGKSEAESFRMAMVRIQKNDLDNGAKVLASLIRANPKKSLYWFNLGNVYFLRGQDPYASYCYKKTVDLKSPLSPVALFYMAKSQRRLKKNDAAHTLLVGLANKRLPKNLAREIRNEMDQLAADYLETGLQLNREEKLTAALHELSHSIALKPSSEAEALRGIILLKQGKMDAATASLQRSVATATTIEKQMEAREILAAIRPYSQKERPESLALSFSGSYSSNFDAIGESEEKSGTTIGKLGVDYRYQFADVVDPGAALNAAFALEEIWRQPEERRIKGAVYGHFGIPMKTWRVFLLPKLQLETKAASLYLFQGGVRAAAEKNWGSDQLLLSVQHLQSVPMATGPSELAGYTETLSASYGWSGPDFLLSGGLSGALEKFPDIAMGEGLLPVSAKVFGPNLSALWQDSIWQLEAQLSYQFRFFEVLAQPGNVARQDREFMFGVGGGRNVASHFRLFLAFDLVANQSSLGKGSVDDRNYTQWNGRGGMVWEIQ